MPAAKSKPRGLYYADDETRKRVARTGGKARAAKFAENKARQNAR